MIFLIYISSKSWELCWFHFVMHDLSNAQIKPSWKAVGTEFVTDYLWMLNIHACLCLVIFELSININPLYRYILYSTHMPMQVEITDTCSCLCILAHTIFTKVFLHPFKNALTYISAYTDICTYFHTLTHSCYHRHNHTYWIKTDKYWKQCIQRHICTCSLSHAYKY